MNFPPNKLRLSCRVADWLGDTDIDYFSRYFEKTGGFFEAIINGLSEGEAIQILRSHTGVEPIEFIKEAKSRNIQDLLKNPQALLLLAKVVENNEWPETKTELFENATLLLASENNETHQALSRRDYTDKKIVDAAGCVFSASILNSSG